MSNKIRNDLLNRHECEFVLSSKGAPSIAAASAAVAREFESEEDRIVIRKISNQYGTNDFLIEALIYDSSDVKLKIEPRPKQKKAEAK